MARYLNPTALFTLDGERINLLNLLQIVPDGKIDASVLVGTKKEHHIPCRLIAFRVSQSVADRRLAIARKKAKGRGTTPKKEYLEILGEPFFSPMLQSKCSPSNKLHFCIASDDKLNWFSNFGKAMPE